MKLCLSHGLLAAMAVSTASAFAPSSPTSRTLHKAKFSVTQRSVLKEPTTTTTEQTQEEGEEKVEDFVYPGGKIPRTLRVEGRGIPNRKDKVQLLDTSTYESSLIKSWESDPDRQKGFDWEIEKMRRLFAGLRMREDGSWVKQPSPLDFLVNQQRVQQYQSDIAPVNVFDVAMLFALNILSAFGLGPILGMSAVPNAVIGKYEGSMFSFIKGVLGGDLQTLAGGPLFLLLNKYFLEYGPIFNLAFGPKAFLVISDPVMARHILAERTTEEYCKGMLAEILEPIMGKGLIPADPATWRVSALNNVAMRQHGGCH